MAAVTAVTAVIAAVAAMQQWLHVPSGHSRRSDDFHPCPTREPKAGMRGPVWCPSPVPVLTDPAAAAR
jgi:hypothetical protein